MIYEHVVSNVRSTVLSRALVRYVNHRMARSQSKYRLVMRSRGGGARFSLYVREGSEARRARALEWGRRRELERAVEREIARRENAGNRPDPLPSRVPTVGRFK